MFTRFITCAILGLILIGCKPKDELSPWIQLTFKDENGIELQNEYVHVIQNENCELFTTRVTDQAGHIIIERDEDLAVYYLNGGRFAYRSFSVDDRIDLVHAGITVFPRQIISLHIQDTLPDHYIELLQWVEQPTCVDSLNLFPRVYVDSANRWPTPIDTTLFFSAYPCETLLQWEVRNDMDIIVRQQTLSFDVDPTSTTYQLGPF